MPATIVCVYFNDFVRTGGQRRYLELVQQLGGRGNDVTLIKSDAIDLALSDCRAVSLRLRARRLLPFSLSAYLTVRRSAGLILSCIPRADWVMIHGESHFFAGARLSALLGARLLFAYRSNTVVESGISYAENRGHPLTQARIGLNALKYRLYERLIGRRADVLVFQSDFDRDSYLSRVPAARPRCAVVPGNIGEPRFKQQHRDTNRSVRLRRVAFVGGLGERKGIRYLLQAMEELLAQGRDLVLDVVGGGGALQRWQERITQGGLADRIRLLGRQDDPFPIMAASDLVVVPSLFDSYPDVVLEALHVGTPVIGSAVGGIPDILGHDELLFAPRSHEAIRDRIASLLDDPSLYLRVRDLCRARRQRFHFDWAEAFERLMPPRVPSEAPP